MVSHQAPGSSSAIPALQASGGSSSEVHVPDRDHVYPHPHQHPHHSRGQMSGLTSHRPLGQSMLAYSQRMREIAQLRQDSVLRPSLEQGAPAMSSLPDARFHKGPPVLLKKTSQQPRPLTLDELLGRTPREESILRVPKKKTTPRNSVTNRVPPSPAYPLSALDKDKPPRVHISFVSASDLIELVNFSLRSKPSRDETMKQARYEASFKLMKEPDLWESLSSAKKTVKVDETKEDGEDKETLTIRGFTSPLETQKNCQRVTWASRNADRSRDKDEINTEAGQQRNRTSEKEKPSVSDSVRQSPDPLSERHFILRQPQKLRHRPKRAKRMTLHRSLLSAIPEDERRRQEAASSAAQTQERPSTRLPIIPTSSSLTAIKSTRRNGAANGAPFLEPTAPRKAWDDSVDEKDAPSSHTTTAQGDSKESSLTPRALKFESETVENDEKPKLFVKVPTPKKQSVTPRDDHSVRTQRDAVPRRRKSTGDRSSSWQSINAATTITAPEGSRPRARGALTGQSLTLLAQGSRSRPNKKFNKLIFLRDTPDHAYYRCT